MNKQKMILTIRKKYEINVNKIIKINKGFGTSNWLIESDSIPYFLKIYDSTHSLNDEKYALHLSKYAFDRDIRTPKIIPTLSKDLICMDDEHAFTLFEYVQGNTLNSLSIQQMRQTGRLLGQIHRIFTNVNYGYNSETCEWMNIDVKKKENEITNYLKIISNKKHKDEFDEKNIDVLQQKNQFINLIPNLISKIPQLSSQVIHGDYSILNLLFDKSELKYVVDFRPPIPFLISYEIGRIAFPPEHFSQKTWKKKGFSLIDEYCKENRINCNDVIYAPHIWLLQLIKSTYGIKEHYSKPHNYQRRLDKFWFERHNASIIIYDYLEELKNGISEIWKKYNK